MPRLSRALLLLVLPLCLLGGCSCRRESAEERGAKPPRPLPYRVVHVLCYHHFTATPKSVYDVKPADLREQMQTLKTAGYQSISCQQLADYLANVRDIPAKSVVISFDDGRLSFQEVARPILDEFGFKAVLFVNSGSVGAKNYLGWEQLQALAQAGHEINSHTVTHMNLTKKPKTLTIEQYRKKVAAEVRDCYEAIRDRLGTAPVGLAYPFGNYDEFVTRATREAGHRLGFSIDPGAIDNKTNPWMLPRKMIVNGTSLKTFERYLDTEPLHLTNIQPPRGVRLTSRQYRLAATVLDQDAAAAVNAEGGRGNKAKYDPATQQITVTSRLNRGANLIRLFSTGSPRREVGWIVVCDVAD